MSSSLAYWFFGILSRMPLSLLHRMGVAAGWVIYSISGKYAFRLRENLQSAYKGHDKAELQKILNTNVGEVGKGAAELPWVWGRPFEEVIASVKSCEGWELIESARRQGKGVIMLTPHMGCFEVISLYVSSRMPMTSMYRTPKLVWLDKVMRAGRERGQMKLAQADIGGVRALLKALKRGEVIGILPDQVPGNGEGEWTPFFGRPAYTMTLVGRLAKASGAPVLLSYSERLPHGAGYIIRITPLEAASGAPDPMQLNAALEKVIRSCPDQYLWSYNRYKTPAGALPPDTAGK